MEETKTCIVCKETKPISYFYKSKKAKDLHESRCKICMAIKNKKYRENNRQKCIEASKKWREENKDKISEKQKQYRYENKDRIKEIKKEYRKNNQKKIKLYTNSNYEKNKAWRKEHENEIKEYQKNYRKENKERLSNYYKEKYKTDIQYKLRCDYGHIASRIIKAKKITEKQKEIIGCDYETFIKHIESLFTEGMSWDNFGVNGWNVDHIIPINAFDLTDYEQVKKCFNYKNTQPLWSIDNSKKGDKISEGVSSKIGNIGEFYL